MSDRDKYDQELLKNISDSKNWPGIENTDLIVQLMRIANKQINEKTVEGSLAAVLIYQQIIEEYLINLMKLSHLYVKGEIWPARIDFPIKKKMMFGQLLDAHKTTIEFNNKEELIQKCREFNEVRIKFVHKIFGYKNTEELISESDNLHDKFIEIGNLFWKGREYIEWQLSDLNDRVDWKLII